MKAKALLSLPKLISPRLLARKKKGGQKLFPLKNSIKEIICTDNINSSLCSVIVRVCVVLKGTVEETKLCLLMK